MKARLGILAVCCCVSLVAVAVPAYAEFGISSFDSQAVNQDGSVSSQAGGHPYSLTTNIAFNTTLDPVLEIPVPDGNVRDVVTDLPPGLLGNPMIASERCELAKLVSYECPIDSQVGLASTNTVLGVQDSPIYDVIAPPNVPAEFAFAIIQTPVVLTPTVHNGTDYGLTVSALNASQTVPVLGASLTFWGVPADPSHDIQRCSFPDSTVEPAVCNNSTNDDRSAPHRASGSRVPFLRSPTSCGPAGVGLETGVAADAWLTPGVLVHAASFSHLPSPNQATQVGTTGCGVVPFDPSISVAPGSGVAGAPSGWTVAVTMPQNENPDGLAQADLKKAVVRLPEGVTVNPSAADGLGSCSSAQIGLLGTDFPEPAPVHFTEAEPACPENSRIGTAVVKTPLLSEPLEGSVFLASQEDNPFHSLLAIYVVVKGPGVLAKLPGLVQADPVTGRLTATFDNDPQVPFSSLKLSFKEGPRAPLVNPAACGSYETGAAFSSWAQPEVPVNRNSVFQITSGAGGGACGSLGFSPSFAAGTVAPNAGAFSPFVLSFWRGDGEQQFKGLTETLPEGLLAKIAGVALCSDAQAATSACPSGSEIGSVNVGSGAGPDPFFLKGHVYLTGPYNGGPYGIAVVVPAVAGPFNLGNVVVRGSIRIDPHTAQATVVSDAFPQFVGSTGIPTDVRRVDVSLDREKFTFNPTNCAPLSVTGSLSSVQDASSPASSGFQAVNCAKLAFHPSFKVSVGSRSTRQNGIGLNVKVSSGTGQANIHTVKVNLPKMLPSRESTLKLACPDIVFEANPSGCPPGSNVGTATASTPVLTKTLSGPAYLVSHGGAAFPDLEIVLQGEGVTLVLDGKTNIKNGITTSTFPTVPDAPVSSFELKLPAGPHSILAAIPQNGSLCAKNMTMPTLLTAQNGAVIKQATKINVTGCAKHKNKPHKKTKGGGK